MTNITETYFNSLHFGSSVYFMFFFKEVVIILFNNFLFASEIQTLRSVNKIYLDYKTSLMIYMGGMSSIVIPITPDL